ncbi:hypothetical protein [Microtetraspora malaysiensis]|uniref:hypothetical protein n=1 Tax=Microtetraspora malaysiensis TaxID=161358 RepID=UPI003D8D48D3
MDIPQADVAPKKRMTWQLKAVLWCFLVVWIGWIACSMVALNGSSIRPQAGSSGGMIAIDVVAMAITGDSTVSWALTGSRVFGVAMALIIVGLLIRHFSASKKARDERSG